MSPLRTSAEFDSVRWNEQNRIVNAYAATPESFPALVLNADFRPLSYYPLSLWSWQEIGEGGLSGAGEHRLRV